jgi:hypothetical protein
MVKEKMRKKSQTLNLFDIIAGLFIIAGGVFVVFSYPNLGTFVSLIGTIAEAIKILIIKGWLS